MKIKSQKINKHRCYTIKELSDVLDISPKTCFRWIADGLPVLDESKKPVFIMGSAVKEYLQRKSSAKKCPLKRKQFYCMHCKGATYAKRGSAKIITGKKLARCRVCNHKISRTIKPHQKDYMIHSPPT
jgi:hypothetical protein